MIFAIEPERSSLRFVPKWSLDPAHLAILVQTGWVDR
jgi:hypothetical protein